MKLPAMRRRKVGWSPTVVATDWRIALWDGWDDGLLNGSFGLLGLGEPVESHRRCLPEEGEGWIVHSEYEETKVLENLPELQMKVSRAQKTCSASSLAKRANVVV